MKQLNAQRLPLLFKTLCLIVPLMVSGCGDSDSGSPSKPELGDIAAYSQTALRELAAAGDSEKAIQILRARSETLTATIADYLLLAEIHIDQLEPAGASSALERAEMMGATKQVLALHTAEMLMLEGRFEAARTELQLIPMIGRTGFKVAMLRGKIESAVDDTDSARRYFGAAQRLTPTSIEPAIELALLEFAANNTDTAFELAQSTKNNPAAAQDPRPDYILGAISRLRRDNEAAISYLKNSLEINPDSTLTQLELTGAWLDAGEREKAQTSLDQILARAPRNPIAQFYVAYMLWQDGENTAAKDLILKNQNLLTNYRPAKKLFANAAFDTGDYADAAKYFRQYLTEVPGDLEVRLKLTNSLQQLGQPADALRIVSPALPKKQTVTENDTEGQPVPAENTVMARVTIMALSQAGYAELTQNNIDAARQKYSEAHALAKALDPADPELARPISIALASLEFNTGEQNTGLALMKQAMTLGQPTANQLVTFANMQIQMGKLADAAETVKQIESIEDAGPIKDNVAGTLAMSNKDYEGAIAAFSRAIDANSGYLSAIKNRAAAYIENDMYPEALADLQRIEPQAAADGQFHAMMGKVQQRLGNYVAAINAYENALNLAPNSAFLHANYALMLGEKERYKEAVAAARKALTFLPKKGKATTQVRALLKEWKIIIERADTLGT